MKIFDLIGDRWQLLLDGLWVTIQVTVGGCVLALIIAFILGMGAYSDSLLVRAPARIVIEFFRGTSLVVQLVWFAFAMPLLLGFRIDSLLMIGIIVLALNYGAYGAEVVRGAITAIPQAQWEACVALNFTYWQKMRLVVIPQAWVGMIPPFSNLAIQTLKGSALVTLIGLVDVVAQAENLRTEAPPGEVAVLFLLLMGVYFILSYLIAAGMRLLERRAKAGVGESQPPKRSIFAKPAAKASGGAVA